MLISRLQGGFRQEDQFRGYGVRPRTAADGPGNPWLAVRVDSMTGDEHVLHRAGFTSHSSAWRWLRQTYGAPRG